MEAKREEEGKKMILLLLARLLWLFFSERTLLQHHTVWILFSMREGIIQQKPTDMLEFSLLQLQYQTRYEWR